MTRLPRALWIALALAAAPASAFGLARFAYAVLLPPMQADLGWSYATAALLNTVNALGYLGGAVFASRLGRRMGVHAAFGWSLLATALALGASALSTLLPVLLVLRLVAGFSGAVTFILGAALTAALAASRRAGTGTAGAAAAAVGASARVPTAALLMGVYVAGGGLGIVVSGLALPWALNSFPDDVGWRVGWGLLGAVGLVAWAVAARAARRVPAPAPRAAGSRAPVRGMVPLLVGYTLFGMGYIAYMTFIVALLRGDGATDQQVAVFWVVLGLAAVAGGFAWAPVVERLQGGRAPALLMVVVALGAGLPLLWAGPVPALASAVLFGGTFLALVGSVTHAAQRVLPAAQVADGIGLLTTVFALGQSVGPVLSGVLADSADGVRAGIALSVAIVVLGAVAFLPQRRVLPEAATTAGGAA